ncbi:MAG: ShlB/FhaC/HecB family hemolysin secretion/activation protein [Thermodesulfobacteriota bacterium]|nr:ShlB/FhaC/HecB family hemolysin secretion/activation protein [Thermodesulfobacteriota bacterium]
MIYKTLLFATIILLSLSNSAWTQSGVPSGPADTLKRGQDVLKYYQLEEKLKDGKETIEEKEEEIVDEEPEPVKVAPKVKEQTFLVKKIITNPSEILSKKELDDILTAYEGKIIAIKDLFQIIDEINSLYRSKNMIAAKAILPPQKIKDGIVKIQLIEGHIGDIAIEGNKYTKDSYFRKRIDIQSGGLVDIDELKKNILHFNNTNDVRIRAELKPGSTFGTTDYVLNAQEPKNYDVTLWCDNAGRDDVGRYRLGAVLSSKSLLGYRDPLTLGGYWAEGTSAGFINYSIPLNRFGTRLGGSYDYNQIEIISGAFEPLDISGESYDLSGSLSHPFIGRRNLKLNGFLEYHDKESSTDFGSITLYESEVKSGVLGFDMQSFDARGMWYSRNSVTVGSESVGSDKNFVKFNTITTRLQVLKNDRIATFRLSGQAADTDLLPSSEQFQIGGLSTVRGFTEGLLSGDQGYVINLQLDSPLPYVKGELFGKPARKIFKWSIFLDHGGAFPYKGHEESIGSEDFLTSAGLGLLFNFNKYVNGRIFWGVPLDDHEDNSTGMIHFYLWASFL